MTCACWDPGCPNTEPYDRTDDPHTYLDPDRPGNDEEE